MSLEQTWNQAMACCQAQRWHEARPLLEQLAAAAPQNPDVAHALGLVHFHAGDKPQAVVHWQRCVQLNPRDGQALSNLGRTLTELGQFAEALPHLDQAVLMATNDPLPWLNRAFARWQLQQFDLAQDDLVAALRRDPHSAIIRQHWVELIPALLSTRIDSVSLAALRVWSELAADDPLAHFYLAALTQQRGDLTAATTSYERALQLNPKFVEAWGNLAAIHMQRCDYDSAERCLRKALEERGEFVDALLNMGTLKFRTRQFDEAQRYAQQALSLRADDSTALLLLSEIALERLDYEAAQQWLNRTIAQHPRESAAHNKQAVLAMAIGDLDAAARWLDTACQLDPRSPVFGSNRLYLEHYRDGANLDRLGAMHAQWDAHYAKGCRKVTLPRPAPLDAERTLRIGFVSADLGHHPIGYLLAPFFAAIDRRACKLFCYSNRAFDDDVERKLREQCDGWLNIQGLSDDQVAQAIVEDRIDVLIDLSGHTARHRLLVFARQPAPLQASWMGYVGPTGVSTITHFIADDSLVSDELVARYSQTPIRLPIVSCCYQMPSAAPSVSPLSALANGYVTFGSFNNPRKITPAVIAAWSRVLQGVSDARLVMKFRALDNPLGIRRYQEMFKQHGVDLGRITFEGHAPFADMLTRYQSIDLALDSFPYTGGTTSILALWMGVPIVTLRGETVAARQTWAVLRSIGEFDTVTDTVDDYVQRAIALANDLPQLSAMRGRLRERLTQSPLNQSATLARAWVEAVRGAWRTFVTTGR